MEELLSLQCRSQQILQKATRAEGASMTNIAFRGNHKLRDPLLHVRAVCIGKGSKHVAFGPGKGTHVARKRPHLGSPHLPGFVQEGAVSGHACSKGKGEI